MAIAIHLAALLLASVSFANIKTITPKSDEIIEIKAGLGIATIIQIPDTIQSAIMGDQTAYRIEYVDKAVTIKPLRFGARTNLYLITKDRRYNLKLSVVPQNQAYFIVYVKKPEIGSSVKWTTQGKVLSNNDLYLKLIKSAVTSDDFLLLDLTITARKSLKIQASDFWIYEGSESKVIHSLFLSKTELKKDQKSSVGISLKKADFGNKALILKYGSGIHELKLEIPKAVLWK